MSLVPPLILGAVSLGAFFAAYQLAPSDSDDKDVLRKRFYTLQNSLSDMGIDLDNVLMFRLYQQVEILMSYIEDQFLNANGEMRDLSVQELKGLVQVATQTRSVVEALLQDRNLRKIEAEHKPRVGDDPEGIVGLSNIRSWILGGMKAELDKEKRDAEYAKRKSRERYMQEQYDSNIKISGKDFDTYMAEEARIEKEMKQAQTLLHRAKLTLQTLKSRDPKEDKRAKMDLERDIELAEVREHNAREHLKAMNLKLSKLRQRTDQSYAINNDNVKNEAMRASKAKRDYIAQIASKEKPKRFR